VSETIIAVAHQKGGGREEYKHRAVLEREIAALSSAERAELHEPLQRGAELKSPQP
jgi:hypothetical protein